MHESKESPGIAVIPACQAALVISSVGIINQRLEPLVVLAEHHVGRHHGRQGIIHEIPCGSGN